MKQHTGYDHAIGGWCRTDGARWNRGRRAATIGGSWPITLVAVGCLGAGVAWGAEVTSTWSDLDGSWDTAANWTPSTFAPNNGNGGDTYAVTINRNGRTVNLASDATINSLALTAGTVANAAQLHVLGLVTWRGGTVSGTGALNAKAGLTLNSGAPVLSGTLNVEAGTMALSGAAFTLSGTLNVRAPATLAWSLGSPIAAGGTLNNEGTVDATISSANWSNGAINNRSGAVFRRSSGTGTLGVSAAFDNDGTVQVHTGTLVLSGGTGVGSSSGAYQAADGAKLRFGGGTHVLDGSSSVVGLGTGILEVSSGVASLGGGYNVAGQTVLSGGTADFTGTVTSVGALTVGGTANFSSGEVIAPTSLTLTGTLTGSDTIVLANPFTWNAGTVNGSLVLNVNGGMTWASGAPHLDGLATLSLAAGTTLNFAGGAPNVDATLNNYGTVDMQSDADINGAGAVQNRSGGLFRKSVGAGGTAYTAVAPAFNNLAGGQVLVEQGILSLNGGGTGAGDFNVSSGAVLRYAGGAHTWQDGTDFTGAGSVRINSGTVTVEGNAAMYAPFTLAGGTLNGPGNLTLGTDMTWAGGTMGGAGTTTLSPGWTVAINQNSVTLDSRTFVNNGTIDHSAVAYMYLVNGALLQNDGTIQARTSYDIRDNGGARSRIDNRQTFRKTDATLSQVYGLEFDNSGTIDVTDPNGVLQFAGPASVLQLDNGATFSGAGVTRVSGGTLALNGTATSHNLEMTAGTLTGTGTLNGTRFDWKGGTMDSLGTTTLGAGLTMNINQNSVTLDGRTLVNQGTIDHSANAYVYLRNGAVLRNDGTIHVDTSYDMSNNGGVQSRIENRQTFRKTDATASQIASLEFDNSGTVDVTNPAGVLQFGGTGSLLRLDGGATFSGAGVTRVTGGTLALNGTATSHNLELAAGTLTGTGTLNGTRFDWKGGTMDSLGTTTLGAGLTMNINQNSVTLDGRTLVNQGTVVYSASAYVYVKNAAILRNEGVVDIQSSYDFANSGGGGSIVNLGTFRKSAGNTTTINTGIDFNNSGTVEILAGRTLTFSSFTQTGGSTRLEIGAVLDMVGTAVLTINGGGLLGNGTVTAPVSLAGDLAPGLSAGRLDVSGNLTLSSAGSLTFEVQGDAQGTTYDFLNVTGALDLGGGTLRLSLLNSFLHDAEGKSFTVASAGSRTGAFGNVASGGRLWTLEHNGSFQVDYSGSTILLSNWAPIPEPASAGTMGGLAALAALFGRRIRRDPAR